MWQNKLCFLFQNYMTWELDDVGLRCWSINFIKLKNCCCWERRRDELQPELKRPKNKKKWQDGRGRWLRILDLVLAEFRAHTHQEIWKQRGKEDDRQHKTLSYIMQQRPPPCVHSLNSRMDARWQNQQKKQNKSQSRWCVGPTIDVALLQWSSLPLLTCSSNSKKVFFLKGLPWAFAS